MNSFCTQNINLQLRILTKFIDFVYAFRMLGWKSLCSVLVVMIIGKADLNGQFEDVSHLLGPNNDHTFHQLVDEMPLRVSGGVASADVNNDGYIDMVFSLGDNQCVKLLLNDGGVGFVDRTEDFNLASFDFRSSSPHFFDLDDDEYIDLIVGSVDGTVPKLFKNINGERFELLDNPEFGVLEGVNTITISTTDFNNDGLEDLFLSHWLEEFAPNHFWKNLGNGRFAPMDEELGFYAPYSSLDYCHNANFMDINEDGYEDLLLSSDFGTSQVWINLFGEAFEHAEHYALIDENGMGSAIGDFDNDGDMDWFVTSVFDDDGILEGNWGGTGNKMYVNEGEGKLAERSVELGVDDASWGWASSFADINNDGFLDLVVVNGWPQGSYQFVNDKLKIFVSHEGKFFSEQSAQLGIVDTLQGRGLSMIDYNKDGCLDILVSNYRGPLKLYENKCNSDRHFLSLTLDESDQNPFGKGVTVQLFSGGNRQVKMLSNASNYVSQNPLVLHFGLNREAHVDSLIVHWTDGSSSTLYNLEVDRYMHIEKPRGAKDEVGIHYDVYPNPGSSHISIEIKKILTSGSRFFILDVMGRPIKEIRRYAVHQEQTNINDIDISGLNAGKYILVCDTDDDVLVPFIKI